MSIIHIAAESEAPIWRFRPASPILSRHGFPAPDPPQPPAISMTSTAPDLLRRLRTPGYLIMAATSILPLIDLMMAISPMHPGTVMWRFGAVGLVSSAVGAPLLVLTLIYALALLVGDRKVVIAIGVIAAILALLLLLGSGAFTLDALQMKARVNPVALDKFKGASALALLKLLVMCISSIVLAVSAFRSAKLTKREVVRANRPGATLIVGQGTAPKSVMAERADATP
jgi:hypothetical protein